MSYPRRTLNLPRELSILSPAPDGWSRLRLAGATNELWNIWRVDASEDLVEWKPIAILHASRFEWSWTDPFILNYEDPAAPDYRRRYYRASVGDVEDSEWKNQVYFPADLYVAGGQSGEAGLRWIKFAILTDDPARVYYQDSDSYLFHDDFATVHLGPLKGISREEFDRVALHADSQKVVLGALLFPPLSPRVPSSGRAKVPEFGIQFVGLDPYPSEQIARWFRLVSSTVAAPPDTQGIYMPVFEQMPAARLDREFLLARGIEVDTPDRWLSGDICYSEGWVLGKLKYFPPDQIEAAHADGRLTPDDIQFFGGKAAHFGLLRRSIPSNAPPAIAISFDLWDEFMDQALAGGMTLREEIQERLSRHNYPPD